MVIERVFTGRSNFFPEQDDAGIKAKRATVSTAAFARTLSKRMNFMLDSYWVCDSKPVKKAFRVLFAARLFYK